MTKKHLILKTSVEKETSKENIIKKNLQEISPEEHRRREARRKCELIKEAKELGVSVEELM